MRYSIITPTILRPTLSRMCESLDVQTYTDWEHLVVVDGDSGGDPEVLTHIAHPQRRILFCDRPHKNWGASCRHRADLEARGDYLWHIDDDNYLADAGVLETLKVVTAEWAIFPILRHGAVFYHDPPGMCRTDSGNFVVKNGCGLWPDTDRYETDGLFVEELRLKYDYQALAMLRPLMVMPSSRGGV